MYRKEKTISLGQRLFVFDIDCSNDGYVCISASNNSTSILNHPKKSESDSVLFTSPSGLYIALEEKKPDNLISYMERIIPLKSILQL